MDGISESTLRSLLLPDLGDAGPAFEHTLRQAIHCRGVALHGGQQVNLLLLPAAAGTGIVFRRTDLGLDLPARHDWVSDTRLCTLLSDPERPELRVGTVEHLLAALAACGVDNAVAELDGPEVPVLDGSAAPFVFLIDCAGRTAQPVLRRVIEIMRPVRVEEGEAWAELRPHDADVASSPRLLLSMRIDFRAAAIGRQSLSLELSEVEFRTALQHARTFTQVQEIDALRAAGLARGGSLENAVVVDGTRVLNPGGLRMGDEFVRHKMLDAVGDLSLAGARLHGRFVGHRSGHRLNNLVLRALLADSDAWRWAALPAEPEQRVSRIMDRAA
jgi:UDP-3-O-[3-hydroxymyristoyl] N-acetylglucosamine deacetylase